jgi:hypothetical protein
VFAITGVYLMLVKHVLIVGMIGLVIAFNNAVRGGAARSEADEKLPARLNVLLRALSVCGTLVILLTVFAQA